MRNQQNQNPQGKTNPANSPQANLHGTHQNDPQQRTKTDNPDALGQNPKGNQQQDDQIQRNNPDQAKLNKDPYAATNQPHKEEKHTQQRDQHQSAQPGRGEQQKDGDRTKEKGIDPERPDRKIGDDPDETKRTAPKMK